MEAKNLWGRLVHDTQRKLSEIHGKSVHSIVIGPAGEKMVRNASITTSNDNVAAKSGFGAVFGSKNLKAITVKGTGGVIPADVRKVLELRKKTADPLMKPKPVTIEKEYGLPGNASMVEGGLKIGYIACSHGCNQHCTHVMFDVKFAFRQQRVSHVEKCVSIFAFGFNQDVPYPGPGETVQTRQNHTLACKLLSREVGPPDTSDPYFKDMFQFSPGDTLNFWKPDFDKGSIINDLCNEYGIDKWDVIIWLLPWLSMGKKEGVFDDIDFGMEIDVESSVFVKHLIDSIVYRTTYYGDLLAEGMARARSASLAKRNSETLCIKEGSRELPESGWIFP